MSDQTTRALVLRDAAGDVYVLTDELLARARASDEQRAAIEAALGDVEGFTFTPVPIPSAQTIRFEGGGGVGLAVQISALQLVLPRTTLAEAKPAIGPRPGV